MSSSYIAYADLTAFADEQTVKDLLSDDGDYAGDPASDTKLLMLMAAASGQVEAACGVSNMYTPEELAALEDNTLALLKQITSALCLVMLVRRRPEKFGSEYWAAVEERTEKYLDRLRRGERLFDDANRRAAGVPTIDGPSAATMSYLNLIPSRTHNFFPNAGTRLPIGRA